MWQIAAAQIGMQLMDGYFKAQNVEKMAEIQMAVAEMNAEFAELDAYKAEAEGYSNTARYQTTIDKVIGDQKLAMAVSGVDTSSGTAAAVLAEDKFIGELNKMEIHKQAREKASGYRDQARQYRLNAFTAGSQGAIQSQAAMTNAITSSVSTGIEYYNQYNS